MEWWFEERQKSAETDDTKPEEQRDASNNARRKGRILSRCQQLYSLKHRCVEQQDVHAGDRHDQDLQLKRWVEHEEFGSRGEKTDSCK